MAEQRAIVNLTINQGDAVQRVKELTSLIGDLNKKKAEALKAGDTKGYAEVQKQLKIVNKELIEQKKFAVDADAVLRNINKVKMGDIYAALKLLRKELELTDRDSAHYTQTLKNIHRLESQITDHRNKTRGSDSKLFDWVKNVALIGGLSAVLSKITSKAQDAYMAFTKHDDKLADVQKTTGLLKDETKNLNAELAKIDTRTSQEELLGLAYQAGKLGISAEKDVLKFVDASDKIGVALGDDLGGKEQAINTMGKIVDLFKIKDKYGMSEGMLKVGSAINALGAASTANEGYIVDFASRTGGISVSAKIASTDIMGLGAAFDSLNAPAEASATVINQVVVGMFSKTEEYAKIARMGIAEFTNLLKSDANDALLRVLEGFNGQDLGFTASMLGEVGENGARAAQAVSLISGNIEMVREQQQIANEEFEKGTGIIDEFNIKNNTAAAQQEKQLKKMQSTMVGIGETLSPVFTAFYSGGATMVQLLGHIIKVMWDYRSVLIAVVTAYTAIYVAQKKKFEFDKITAAFTKIKILLNQADAASITAGTLATAGYTVSQKALIAVKMLVTLQFRAAAIAAKAFWVSLGPVGWAITALGALATAMSILGQKTKEVKGAYAEYALTIREEQSTYEDLKKRLNETNQSTTERADLIKVINDHYREYLPSLLTEKSTTEQIATAIDKATIALRKNTTEKIRAREMESAEQALYDVKKNTLNELLALYDRNRDKSVTQMALASKQLANIINDAEKFGNDEQTRIKAYNAVFNMMGYQAVSLSDFLFDKYVKVNGVLTNTTTAITNLNKGAREYENSLVKINALFGESNEAPVPNKVADEGGVGSIIPDTTGGGSGGGDLKKKWSLESDQKFSQERIKLKMQLFYKEIATEDEFNRQLSALEISVLEQRLSTGKEKGEERLKLLQELTDKQYNQQKKEQERLAKLQQIVDGGKSSVEQEQIRHEAQLRELGLFGVQREQMTQLQMAALVELEKQHTQKLSAINFASLNKQFDQTKEAMQDEITQLKVTQNNELSAIKSFADKKLLLSRYYSASELRQITTDKQADKAIKAAFQKEEIEIQEKHLKNMLTTYQSMIGEYQSSGTIFGNVITGEDVEKLNKIIANLKKQLTDLGANIEFTPEKGLSSGADILGMTPDNWETLFKNLKESKGGLDEWSATIGAVGQAVGQAFSDVSNLMSAIEQRELKSYEKTQNKKKQALEKQLKAGTISQESYNQRVQDIDQQTEAKRLEIEQKQAKRQKMLSVFQALVNTAVAITSALTAGPIAGPILAGIIGALGAIQVAAIIAQPLPGAQQGGMLVERTQDGKHFNAEYAPQKRGRVNSPTVIVGENGTEYVVPAQGYQNPTIRPVLNMIETARRSGTLQQLDLASAMAASYPGRETGGALNDIQISDAKQQPLPTSEQDNGLIAAVKELTTATRTLNDKLPYIKAYVMTHGKGGVAEAMKKYDSIKKNI